jgi:hypothetical protein
MTKMRDLSLLLLRSSGENQDTRQGLDGEVKATAAWVRAGLLGYGPAAVGTFDGPHWITRGESA